MPQEPPSGGSLMHWLLSEGSRLPSLTPSPPCYLTVSFPSKSLPGAITDEMFSTTTMVAVFLICLDILNSPCQVYHELFHNSFNFARIITLLVFIISTSPSSKCAKCTAGYFRMGWLPLSFLRGKKLVALSLGGVSVTCVLELQGNSMESSFSASWVALM